MDVNELFGYINEGTKLLAIAGGGIFAYLATLGGLEMMASLFYKKIETQKELDSIVSDEARRLGMNQRLKAYLHEEEEGMCKALDDGSYEVHIGGSRFSATRGAVKHELYHIYRGDFKIGPINKLLPTLCYFFVQEPRAALYEAFGIKL